MVYRPGLAGEHCDDRLKISADAEQFLRSFVMLLVPSNSLQAEVQKFGESCYIKNILVCFVGNKSVLLYFDLMSTPLLCLRNDPVKKLQCGQR